MSDFVFDDGIKLLEPHIVENICINEAFIFGLPGLCILRLDMDLGVELAVTGKSCLSCNSCR